MVYLDGNEMGRTTNGGTTTANVTGFRLGQDAGDLLHCYSNDDPPVPVPCAGHGPDPSQFDEVRISNIARTSDWIKTEFNNQNDPGSFYTFGAEVLPH